MRAICAWLLAVAVSLLALPAHAAAYPPPTEGDWIAPDFRFHTGEVLSAPRLHYTTIGDPAGEPVLILHGTGQSGSAMLTPAFAGALFGPNEPLDATKYFIILPDALGNRAIGPAVRRPADEISPLQL